jgi:acyl-CoA thioesterase-1
MKIPQFNGRVLNQLLVITLTFLMVGCQPPPITNRHSRGITIVCFGGSLTRGGGADKGYDYPSQLGKMVNIPVINAGINGNNTRQELQRVQKDVFPWAPKMVIVTQRANDLKSGIPKEETLRNLEDMIDQIQNHGAIAVLVTFEPEALRDYFQDVRKLVLRKHALLVADVAKGIQSNPHYMSDDVHPNNIGYRVVAERIYKIIKPFLKGP